MPQAAKRQRNGSFIQRGGRRKSVHRRNSNSRKQKQSDKKQTIGDPPKSNKTQHRRRVQRKMSDEEYTRLIRIRDDLSSQQFPFCNT